MTKFPPFNHASISRLAEDWRRPRGRPRQCWLRTVEADSNHSTLACIQHVSVQPGFRLEECRGNSHASWTGAPPHDDDDDDDIHPHRCPLAHKHAEFRA